jgi:hypothetical protein
MTGLLSRKTWTIRELLTYVAVVVGDREQAKSEISQRLLNGELRAHAQRFYVNSEASGSRERRDVAVPADFWEWAEVAWLQDESYAHRRPWFRFGYRPDPASLDPLLTYQVFGARFASAAVRELWPAAETQRSAHYAAPPRSEEPALIPAGTALPRQRGPRPTTRERVKNLMRRHSRAELEMMKEEAMSATFGASRDTCRKARAEVLSEFSVAELRQTPTIDN